MEVEDSPLVTGCWWRQLGREADRSVSLVIGHRRRGRARRASARQLPRAKPDLTGTAAFVSVFGLSVERVLVELETPAASEFIWLSVEAFFRGFPTGLSHVPPWCESILGLKVEAVQGKQVPVERTEISGGVLEWWHDPAVPLPFPLESASSWQLSN